MQEALDKLHSMFEKKEVSPLQKAQKAAWDRFLELGLPSKRDEAFRYLRLNDLFFNGFKYPSLSSSLQVEEETFLLFHNGRFLEKESRTSLLPKEMIVLPLTKAWRTFGNYLATRFLESVKSEKNPFALLNAALCEEGVFIYLPPHTQCEVPLSVIHLLEGDEGFSCPRLHICLGKGASLKLHVKEYPGEKHFQNGVMDLLLEEGASLQLTTLSMPRVFSRMESMRAMLKKGSKLQTWSVTNGGKLFRQDAIVTLAGEGAHAELKGITLVDEKREGHVHLEMRHLAPHTTSLQKYKNVLGGFSRTSFEGKIVVASEAQKTLAYQMNPNLLLSDHASASSRPNLEIFADDVKASHGSTFGQLDQEHLFYLKSRGMTLEKAKKLLICGFCKEIIDEIEDLDLRKQAAQFVSF